MTTRAIREKHSDELCKIGEEVYEEALHGIEVHGEQAHRPTGLSSFKRTELLLRLKAVKEVNDTGGGASWSSILEEEFLEAMTEANPAKRADELIQVAAVAQRWAILLRREAGGKP